MRRLQEIEQELEKLYDLRTEYDRKIGLEGDPRQREKYRLDQTEVVHRIEELEAELAHLPQSARIAFFHRNYINLVDMERQLVGRQADQQKLEELLTNGGCVAILGVGGQGKTSLAYSYLKPYLNNPQQFEAAIWLTIEGNGTDLTGLAERLDFKPASNLNETAEAVREYLSSHLVLVILDNFETAIREDGSLPLDVAALLQRLAEFRGQSRIIITTREIPKGYRLKVLALDGLTPEGGADLLAEQGLGDEDRSQLVLASHKARGNPFALKLLADLATDPFTGDTLENMLQQGDLWDKELAERLLRKIWDTRLTEEERRLLRVLAILRPPARRATLLNLLAPTTDVQLRDLLGKLANKSLLSAEYDLTDPKKLLGYDLHPLFRRFIQTEELKQQTRIELHQAAVDYFKSLIPSLPPKEGYQRKSLKDVWPVIEAVHHLNELENYQAAFDLFGAEELYSDLERWGQAALLIDTYNRWLSLEAFSQLDARDKARILANLGTAYQNLRQVEKAITYFEQAQIVAEEIGADKIQSIALSGLGRAYRSLRQLDQSIGYFQKALTITQKIGDRKREGVYLRNLGTAYQSSREIEKALQYYEQALVVAVETGYKEGEANALGDLAYLFSVLGQIEKSINYYQQALVIDYEIGNTYRTGNHLANLGSTYKKLNQLAIALAHWRKGGEIMENIKAFNAKKVQNWIEELREELGEEAFTKTWAESESEYQKLKAVERQ